ncbi:carbohydrate ABC transporter permease [Paenibacillus pasadenensis]|uniref:carbohydrate ABC transporter permease n=1 Tax=Paenibacillus pasadenensis TaxID=217090 RepID=UPI00203F2D09|nr:carbohydrate ABC transporter permease [Paenibacillus pasadenensis]MCM3747018.1 carbohydrate ABC transporter permease [Paenibacillus pasadenensis]
MSSTRFGSRAFDIFNVLVMIAVVIVTLGPFWFTIVGSLNNGLDYLRGGVYFWPREFTWANYRAVLVDSTIYQAFMVTGFRTIVGTLIHVLFTSLIAYGMSRTYLIGRNFYMAVIMFTMFFGGGLIPTYILYKDLGLLNTVWVYIVPGMFSVWDMIIIMSFMRTIPDALLESARMDGAGEYRLFLQFILPLSKPVLAAITLFNGVYHWNSYFDAMMFTTKDSLQTVQLFLMRMVTSADFAQGVNASALANIPSQAMKISPETMKLAMMMVVSIPIILIYPFLQKYFVKGIMIGSIKG